MKPDIRDAHQHPKQHGVGVKVHLDKVRFSGKLLAGLVPAPHESQGQEGDGE